MKTLAVLAAALALPLLSFTAPAPPDTAQVQTMTRNFLDSYARGDRDKILAMVAPDATVYGSDAAEFFKGTSEIATMMGQDRQLWNGSARIGPMQQVSIIEQGNMASMFFNAPFSAGGREPLPVRFAIVWRRTEKQWKLVQCSSSVPTQGQSAEKLLQSK